MYLQTNYDFLNIVLMLYKYRIIVFGLFILLRLRVVVLRKVFQIGLELLSHFRRILNGSVGPKCRSKCIALDKRLLPRQHQ